VLGEIFGPECEFDVCRRPIRFAPGEPAAEVGAKFFDLSAPEARDGGRVLFRFGSKRADNGLAPILALAEAYEPDEC
jgi:hypothetical protein